MRGFFSKTLLAASMLFTNGYVYGHSAMDHDQARQALAAGEILSLSKIIEKIESNYVGQILEVELERKDGRWLYEIKILQQDGLKIKLKVNAADGMLLLDKRK